MQEDKIGYGGGTNLYAYVAGAVLDARDPSGMLMDFADALPNLFARASEFAAGLQAWFAGIDDRFGAFGIGGSRSRPRTVRGGLTQWDLMTKVERNYIGNIRFESERARQAFYDLRKQAYVTGNIVLQELTNIAGRISNPVISITEGVDFAFMVVGPGTDPQTRRIHFPVSLATWEDFFQVRGSVLIAHEIGHVVGLPFGVPLHRLGTKQQEPSSGVFYEAAARSAFGCSLRGEYSQFPPISC